MFKEKVNARTDGCTSGQPDGCTTDNRPSHKLAGLWPVELKIVTLYQTLLTFNAQRKNPFENITAFSPFPRMFSTLCKKTTKVWTKTGMSPANS